MKILLVTSTNSKLLSAYSHLFFRTFNENLDPSIDVIVVTEDNTALFDPTRGRFKIIEDSTRAREFRNKFSALTEPRGYKLNLLGDPPRGDAPQLRVDFSYEYDAYRFHHKPFAVEQVYNQIAGLDYDRLVWIDSDTIALKPISPFDLSEFCVKDLKDDRTVMTYLGRVNKYSECGFLGFNLRAADTGRYITAVAEMYHSGWIFSLPEWHDSYVWDHCRKLFEETGVCFENISGPGFKTGHPFVNSGLGKMIDHLKGPARKRAGRSFEKDFI